MANMSHYLTLTQANLDYGHMYLTECMHLFPEDALGGANKSQAAPRSVRVQYGSEVVDTDIVRKRCFFRRRGWVRQFFAENRMVAEDRVFLEQLDPYSYRVSRAEVQQACIRLPCLSIQRPWAELILDGKKVVENRSRTWKEAVQKLEAGGNVLLGVHGSRSLAIWRGLTKERRAHYAPGWHPSHGQTVGAVLGVVELVQICRSQDLPQRLRTHKYAEHQPDNWCWVLKNPRKLVEPLKANGNVWLFHVDIPRGLLPAELGDLCWPSNG